MPFYLLVIIISLLCSLIGLVEKSNRTAPFIYFPIVLLATVVVEAVGSQMARHNRNSTMLYNFFTYFEFAVLMLVFLSLFDKEPVKKIVLITTGVYLVGGLLNLFFFQGLQNFNTYTYIFGSLCFAVFSVIYFYILFQSPEQGSLARNPFFWIISGMLFYYTCSLSLHGLENFIIKKIRHYNRLLFFISDLLNILLYTLFSIGFLCKINFRKLFGLS